MKDNYCTLLIVYYHDYNIISIFNELNTCIYLPVKEKRNK